MKTNIMGHGIGIEDSSFFNSQEIQRTVRLGKYLDGTDDVSFNGKITDVNIWSRGLSAEQSKRWTDCQWAEQDPGPDIGRLDCIVRSSNYELFSKLVHICMDIHGFR